MHKPDCGSWLEALGAFRQPIILKVISTPSGEVPGHAAAYTSLCKYLGVPLLGLIQIGGNWDDINRRLDGLPWLGYLSADSQVESSNLEEDIKFEEENLEEIVFLVHKRFNTLNI